MERPRWFHAATPDEIRDGQVTDADLLRTLELLEGRGQDPHVVAEIRAPMLPADWPWALLVGIEEVLALLEGREVDVFALPEGSAFFPDEPVVQISGPYRSFGALQTAAVGMLSSASGVATRAARLKLASEGRGLYPIGIRFVHPAALPALERAAFVGGCDAVATPAGSEVSGAASMSAGPRDLAVLLGESDAWAAVADASDGSPAIVAVGVTGDDRTAAVAAAEALGGRLGWVRLDVSRPSGDDVVRLVREVRWELDTRGHSRVRLFVCGELDEERIGALARYADAFGVGGSLAAAPPVPFSFDVVEVDGEPRGIRGTLSGRKALWGCERCGNRGIAPSRARPQSCPRCGGRLQGLLAPVLRSGRRVGVVPDAAVTRSRAMREAADASRLAG
jgi:nicotinate phosphoribosyltransferase